MGSRQALQYRRAAKDQFAKFFLQAHILRHVVKTERHRVRSGLAAAGSGIDLREIEIELRLTASAANGAMAEAFRFAPHAFGMTETQSKIRDVIGIFGIAFRSLPEEFES